MTAKARLSGISVFGNIVVAAHVLLSGAVDIRVSKGHYTRGYSAVRVSAITEGAAASAADWQYSGPFQKRWASKSLHTKVLQVGPEGLNMQVENEHIRLRLPAEGAGVTGLLVADPCYTGLGGLSCPNGDRFKILDRLASIINQLVGSHEFDFFAILGDNFYDQRGEVTSSFFERLSPLAQAKPLLIVPGNHDFWITGGPPGMVNDDFGFGFMQFYAQDSVAATKAPPGSSPFSFVREPQPYQLAAAENFIYGTQIGDLAFFGYSGAHSWRETEPHVAAFCNFVGSTPTIRGVVVLGHWNSANLGCMPGMDTPSVHAKMQELGGCASKQVLYFMGHEHCNEVTLQTTGPLDALGFMIGGAGMFGGGCSVFGVTVLQSVPNAQGGPNFRVDHIPVAEDPSFGSNSNAIVDRYDQLFGCLSQSGHAGCRRLYAQSFRAISADDVVTPALRFPPAPGPPPSPPSPQAPQAQPEPPPRPVLYPLPPSPSGPGTTLDLWPLLVCFVLAVVVVGIGSVCGMCEPLLGGSANPVGPGAMQLRQGAQKPNFYARVA